jgi:hypothetical protein
MKSTRRKRKSIKRRSKRKSIKRRSIKRKTDGNYILIDDDCEYDEEKIKIINERTLKIYEKILKINQILNKNIYINKK